MIKFHLSLMDANGTVFDRTIVADCYYRALDKAVYFYGMVSCLQYHVSYPEA